MFVNLSLKSIAFSSLQSESAFFSDSGRSQRNSRFFQDIIFKKSFSPFLTAYSPSALYKFIDSSFTKFLDTAIRIDTMVTRNYTKFQTPIRAKPDDNLEIIYCMFTEISTKKNGGAIFLRNFRYSLFVNRTGFSLCASHLSGGAIYLIGYEFLAYRCCFYGCVALESEQAVYSDTRRLARDEACDNSFNMSFISQCSPRQSKGPRRTIYLSGGMQIFTSDNFTNNHVNEEAAGAITSYPTIFTLKFCDFCKSSGNSILWMHLLEESFSISYCNVFNNSLPGNRSSIIVVEQSRAIFSRMVFYQNYALHYVEGTYSICLQECMFDVNKYGGIFGALGVVEKDTKYYARIKKYKLVFAPTWDCWALGSPSPRQPGIFKKLLYIQDSSTLSVVIVFVIIISVIGIVALIMTKNTNVKDLEDLDAVEIE